MGYNGLNKLPENKDFYKPLKANEVKRPFCKEPHEIELKIFSVWKNYQKKQTTKVYLYYYILTCQSPLLAIVHPRAWISEFKELYFRTENLMKWADIKKIKSVDDQ